MRLTPKGPFVVTLGLMLVSISGCDDKATTESDLGELDHPGMNGSVHAFAMYDGDLVAAGAFTEAGGRSVTRVTRWDGESWQALGEGPNQNTVYALAVHDGYLVAGGRFFSVGKESMNSIARWDGAEWSSLGSGFRPNDQVEVLGTYEGDLIAGGQFTRTGDDEVVNRIARWDGESWHALGTGMNGTVWSLIEYNGYLIAGGGFTSAGGQRALGIARWDGLEWTAFGPEIHRPVTALTLYDGDLIAAGGHIWRGFGYEYDLEVVRWTGQDWVPLGSSIMWGDVSDIWIWDLVECQGRLVAGGEFRPGNLTYYDGENWLPLGEGITGSVKVLSVLQEDLIVGGWFTQALGRTASHILLLDEW